MGFRNRCGTYRCSMLSPPFLPALHVEYPPMMLPEIAAAASSQGFPRFAASNNTSRSVLPGNGKGMIEASITATAKTPSAPR